MSGGTEKSGLFMEETAAETGESRAVRAVSSRKEKIVLAAALILLLVETAVYSAMAARDTKHAAQVPEARMLLDVTADEIDGIAFRAVDGTSISFIRREGIWQLDRDGSDLGEKASAIAADSVPDQEAVSRLAAGVTGVGVRQVIGNPADLREYGLDEPFTEASVRTAAGKEYNLAISATSEGSGSVYVILNGDAAKIFVCVPSVKSNFEKVLQDFFPAIAGAES